jgi:hypothetical protein
MRKIKLIKSASYGLGRLICRASYEKSVIKGVLCAGASCNILAAAVFDV